ncbi:MAG: hypothetical protein KF773_16055 [Deltaproteobacteria bacterium]|nr:hypothetical protein [Deltaproteobacteria bacterium]
MMRLAPLHLLALTAVACQPPGAGAPSTKPAPAPETFTLVDLVGGWRWLLRTQADGSTRIEDETWRFAPVPGEPTKLAARYIRTVEIRSDDRIPFVCNQRPYYRQRAVFDVAVELTTTGFTMKETGYRAEPSPCDHGFRHTSGYTAELWGDRITLKWDGGTQTLWHIDTDAQPLPADPWRDRPITGPWRWDTYGYDDDGNVREENEWWNLTRRSDTVVDGTYRRRVTVRSPDGKPIRCANGPQWSFDDAYVFTGQREEEHWHFNELASEAGDHPCLRATPRRALDEATGEALGDHLILEWRGKRRQVLYRPE